MTAGDQLAQAAAVAAERLGVRSGERVAIVHNGPQAGIAAALRAATVARGATVDVLEYPAGERHGAEPPSEVADALLVVDAAFAATECSISHTRARVQATRHGVRIVTLPTVTESIFGRCVPVDYEQVQRDGAEIAALFTAADECRLTSAEGMDVTLQLRGRDGRNDDGDLRSPGAFGNLPAGEGYVAPHEDAGDGTIVFDGSLAGYGLLEEPLAVTIAAGVVTGAEGPAAEWLLRTLDAAGPSGRRVAELAIGTNPAAVVGGNVLEDEKVRGTAHIAFGSSAGIGGTNQSSVHIDGVILRPTVVLGGRTVVEGGRLRIGDG
jgi:leucyl aminopeptidase (aminopeptidase T)